MTENAKEPLLIVDHNGTIDHTWKLCIGVIRTIFICISQFLGILAFVFAMMLLSPLTYVSEALYWRIEGFWYKQLLMLGASWGYSAEYLVTEAGDDIESLLDDHAAVVVNHQTTADVPTLFYALHNKKNVIKKMMWVQDISFRLTTFGWASIVHGDFFIRQGKETRHLQSERLAKHIEESYLPTGKKWLLLFPEGGFLHNRRKSSQAYAKKNGYPQLQHVTLPRIGALQTILQCLSPSHTHSDANGNATVQKDVKGSKPLKWVIDITVGYPENKALDLLTLLMGTRKPCTTVIHYRKFAVEDVPTETEALTEWLYQRFVEKEQMLDFFNKNGQFPFWDPEKCLVDTSRLSEVKPYYLSDVKVVAVYLIYIGAGCLIWSIFITPVLGLLWSCTNCFMYS